MLFLVEAQSIVLEGYKNTLLQRTLHNLTFRAVFVCFVFRELESYQMLRNILTTRSTQPCIPPGSLNRVPASAGVRTGMSPLPGGR